tara:strand:- start:1211 stop:2074 length:864 start_codon:yes stop_codon:yes gene_type:complete
MPELPEVEIVQQSLSKNIKGKKINRVLVKNRNLRFKLKPYFENKLKGQFISNIQRFSKYIIIMLKNKSFCVIHLGMTGTIHIIKKKKKSLLTNTSFYHSPILPKKHNHIEFFFDDIKLIYNDPRRFGFFLLIKDKENLKNVFKNYGPEPFDKKFNLDYLVNFLKGKKKDIKGFLLDQKFVSGIGNIYASEILYSSKINPLTPAKKLKKSQLRNIIKSSKEILYKAIKEGGSSIRDFKNTTGDTGGFQKKFKVYGRDKKNCKRLKCLGIIDKIIQSNRSTFYCKICQK